MSDLFQLQPDGPQVWTRDDTVAYLTAAPLPRDFTWKGFHVVPTHREVTAYGKWLKETPYHRGLFPLIHRMMERAEYLPTRTDTSSTDELCAWIRAAEAETGKQTELF